MSTASWRRVARIFTEEEHAAAHCQMGNLGLAIDEIRRWLDVHQP